MPHYTYKETSNFIYDATMTQGLLQNVLDDELFYISNSSGYDTHQYILPYYAGTLSHYTGSKREPNPEIYSGEGDGEVVHPSIVYDYYQNFTMATGVNFAEIRSSAVAAGISSSYFPNGLTLCDNTSAGNITFDKYGEIYFAGSNTLANDITFIDGGYVYFTPGEGAGSGTQRLTGLLASKDLDEIAIDRVARGGSVTIDGGQVRRNLRKLKLGEDPNGWTPAGSQTGSGILVDGLVVRGVLNSVYVASGASVNHLTVGLDRQWAGSDVSAFLYESNGVLVPNYWGSHTNMTIESGGTATNITLGNGGTVYVSGPSDTVSSQWISSGSNGDGYWEYTTHYASGTGGILKDLNIASSGGLQFEGINDPRATWVYPSNGYLNSSSYMSGFLATAPQSAYVSFGSNASGSNINIGNGGSLYIGKDAHVSAISMGGLTTSTFFKNSSGTTDTWIGDRGASLQIRGGKVSGVVMDPVIQTFEYYSAAHNYYWLYSSSLEREYYLSHNSTYPSGAAWSSSVLNSAISGGYSAYMRNMYTSGAVYTNFGDDTAYNRRYVGGDIGVAGGWIMNVSGFSYLGVAADVDVKVENNVSSWNTYQYTDGNVSKAVGAVSATLDVTGGAHVYNVKIEGGRVLMVGGGEVNARWHSRENKQSNYNLVEDLDLRIGDAVGLGSAYPAVIEFFGEGSGGYKQYISSGGTSGYVDYTWDAIDPGEIHSVTASKGLVVTANYNKQDFTYIGSGAVTINGLGTVVLKNNHSRYTSDSYYGKGPYLGSAFDTYYFGVVKGVYNEEDGVLENYTVLDGDVSSGGGFDWTGFLMVGSGGIVRNIGYSAPLKTGNNIVNSDTWTPEYDRDACKVLTVVAGGLADNVTVKGAVSNFEHFESQYTESRAGLLVSSGGTATNVTVLEGGIAMAKGGTIDKVFVGAGGTLYLSGWAGAHQVAVDSHGSQLAGPQYLDTTVLNAVRLDSGGQLTNTLDWGFRKGNAPSVIANKGGGIMNGVTANGVAYVSGLDYAGNITLTKDQQAIDVTVRGYKNITSRDEQGNPAAYTTVIASLNVSSGGIVKGATVGEEGAIYVSEGADVSGLTASGGRLIFENAGSGWGNYLPASATVNGLAVEAGGVLEVNSKFGLTATNVQIGQNAGLEFTLGDTASEDYTPTELNGTWTADWGNGTFYTADGTLSGFGGQFGQEYKDLFYSSSYVSARLSMTVAKGGILTGANLRGYGSVRVTSGGKILNTKIKGVGVNIGPSGYASALSAATDPDRTANQTQIFAYGSGAILDDTTLNGGLLDLDGGAVANGVTMTAPEGYTGGPGDSKTYGPAELDIYAGGTANDVVASAGIITLGGGSYKEPGMAGPTLNNADVHSSASIIVMSDDGIMSGKLNLGGTLVTTATRYEYVEVEVTDPDTGNVYPDWQRVEKSNATVDATKLTVNFDLTERKGNEEDAMIDKLSNLEGVSLKTITISADQESGTYVLAQGAESFKGTITVNCDGKKIDDFSVGTYKQVGVDTVYSLTNNSEKGLCFTIQGSAAAVTDILATVDGQPLQKGKWTNKAITIKTSVNKYSQSIWYKIVKAAQAASARSSEGDVVSVDAKAVSDFAPERAIAVKDSAPAANDDGWIRLDNSKGITVTQHCDIQFKAKNANGVDSEIVTYTVNYDDKAAEITDFRSDAAAGTVLKTGTKSQVSVLVKDDLDGAPKLELSTGSDQWTVLNRGSNGRYAFTVAGNGTHLLRATDHAGNVSTKTVKVDFYDTSVTPGPVTPEPVDPEPVEPDPVDPALPDAPDGLSVSVKKYNASLVWNKVAAEKGVKVSYEVWIDGNTFAVSNNKYTIKDVAVGRHSFAVRTVLSDGTVSNWSTSVIENVLDVTPPQTGALNLTQTENGVRLDWDPASDNVGIDRYVVTCGDEVREVAGSVLSAEFNGVAGKVTATVTAYDAAGNAGKTVKKAITMADVIPPSQVTGLRSEGVDSKSGGILAWEPATDNVGVVQYLIEVEGQKVYKSKTNSVKIGKMPAGDHKFTVIAVDKAKNQSIVSEECVFHVLDLTPPKTGALVLEQSGEDGVRLSWTSGTDDVGIDRYEITCGEESRTVDGSVLSAEFSGMAGKITATVTAYDAAGNAGKTVKKNITLKDVTPPTQVTGLRSEGVDNSSGGVLVWNEATDNVGVVQYLIEVEGQKTYKSKTNSVKVKKMPAGTYKFNVVALDKAKNQSIVSEDGSFTVADVIDPKVKKLSAKVADDSANVTWNAIDETGIAKLELSMDGQNSIDVTNLGSYDFAGLPVGVHSLRLTAFDAAGNMAFKDATLNVKAPKNAGVLASV